MCGIAGFAGGHRATGNGLALGVLRRMGDALAHRGPDSDGYWSDPEHGIGFAHRRLAIVDLSSEGAQPMRSASGRYVLCYNGEIYNHQDLRKRLPGPWRGTSDTETLLAGFEAWGIAGTLEACVGMFALALWDHERRELTLARDRFGEKPLYYGWQRGSGAGDSVFLFSSELSALRAHPAFECRINRDALRSYVRLNSVPGHLSIYEGISKLPAGCTLTLSEREPHPQPVAYWSAVEAARRSHAEPFTGSPQEAADQLETLLSNAIRQQMVADVPIGVFLSGGIDSSTIVALMQRQATRPVRSFTIGFREDEHNEADHARAVARHLGTEHAELYVSAADALELIPRLGSIYSEPFADSSQIPTYLLARLTRSHVTVALSGDGGDELFCGYNRYSSSAKSWNQIDHMPLVLRKAMARALLSLSSTAWDRVARLVGTRAGERVQKVAGLLTSENRDELYIRLVSHWGNPGEIVIGGSEPKPLTPAQIPGIESFDPIEQMMLADVLTYMSDDILTKVDRAAMAVSLETRVPMLDHRVAEFAWRLPLEYKLRDGRTKWLLREVLYRHVPKQLIERPKTGFFAPVDAWLRGPLREWADDLLNETRLKREGFFEVAPIRRRWQQHVRGERNWYSQLWNVLMFQAWLEHTNGR